MSTTSTSAARTSSPARSAPMAIPGGAGHHHHHQRGRSDSTASDSSEGTPPPMTPLNTFGARAPAPGTSPTSPIMTMLGQTPLKSPTAFPFAKIPFASAVDDEDAEPPVVRHARRTSMSSSRFTPGFNSPTFPGPQQERGANVLRRLSLGGTFGRAAVPDKSPSPPRRAVEPAVISTGPPVASPPSPKHRRGTMPSFDEAGTSPSPARPRRAPSPMGERILKGHFDSFH